MKRKIKVLMPLELYYPIGGIERFVLNLCNAFGDDLEITWATKEIGPKGFIKYPQKVKVENMNHPILEVCSRIMKGDFDVVFINNGMPFNLVALLTAKAKKVPIVYFCHQVPLYNKRSLIDKVGNALIWSYLRIFVGNCQLFIVPSKAVASEFRSRNFSKEAKVVYPGVKSEQFVPVEYAKRVELREKYLVGLDKKVACWVGRFSPEKNVGMILNVAAQNPEVLFVLAGFRPSAPNNKNTLPLVKSAGLKNIKLITTAGPDVIQEIYQMSDLCVNTSTYETFGSAVAEAAACGITTVVPNFGGIMEAGKEGYLYDYDVKSLSLALENALKEPKTAKNVIYDQDNAFEFTEIFKSLVN